MAENWINFVPPTTGIGGGTNNEQDRVTAWEYNGLKRVTKLTAYNGSGMNPQVTEYLYTDDYNATLVELVKYPDGNTTIGTGEDNVQMTYNLDGSLATRKDQRGVVLTYTYDNARRLIREGATTIPGGVDDHVKSIARMYDALGWPLLVTSYENANGTGAVQNEIQYEYHSTGKLLYLYQSHQLAVNTGTTPKTQFAYDISATSNVFDDGLRPTGLIYPVSGLMTRGYSGTVADRLHRPSRITYGSVFISPGENHYTSYSYNGVRRFAGFSFAHEVAAIPTVQIQQSVSWDRFARTIESKWNRSTTVHDQFNCVRSANRTFFLSGRHVRL